jgi:hypothetical protein
VERGQQVKAMMAELAPLADGLALLVGAEQGRLETPVRGPEYLREKWVVTAVTASHQASPDQPCTVLEEEAGAYKGLEDLALAD